MINNNYYCKARLFPAILTSIPAIILFNKLVSSFYHGKLEDVLSVLPTITDVMLSSAIVYLLVQINRFLSKEIFQRFYFKDEMNMPTTNLLLKSNKDLEISIKLGIEKKIEKKFGIILLSLEAELVDDLRARKLIMTAVSQIRNVLRDNSLLLQHNIEYGFFRDLIGGSLLAFIFSLIILFCSYYERDLMGISLGWILTVAYFLPILFSKLIISRYGKYYAKILYEQFFAIE